MRNKPLVRQLLLVAILLFACTGAFSQKDTAGRRILEKMRHAAREELVDKYYPRNIDTQYGGYLSSFTYNLEPTGTQDKMVVTQARHVWTTSKAALFYKDTAFNAMARHGFFFLQNKMWDSAFGGFYNLVNRMGEPKGEDKEAYGNAFAIYALAAYHAASGDTAALGLARRAFLWLEQHSHDSKGKGYFQNLTRDGHPLGRTTATPSTSTVGYKDQNSSIHLLEAFTELYTVWPDRLVEARLREMLDLLLDKIIQPKGYLQLFLTPDWKPVSFRDQGREEILRHRYVDHVSFGHDVETAFLMLDASDALKGYRHAAVLATGKRMLDHALNNGWDKGRGGFFDEGYYFKDTAGITITKQTKNWWAQAEGLNTLLLFSRLYPRDPMQYAVRFRELWHYVDTYLIDHEHGDWYEEGLDNAPQRKTALKAHIWKGTYHNFRALSHCIVMLQE